MDWDFDVNKNKKKIKKIVEIVKDTIDEITNIKKNDIEFKNTIGLLYNTYNVIMPILNKIIILQYFHSNKKIKKYSEKIEKKINVFFEEIENKKLKNLIKKIKKSNLSQSELELINIIQSGFDINKSANNIEQKINNLHNQFINTREKYFNLLKSDLTGVPNEYLVSNKIKLSNTSKLNDIILIYADDENIRKKIYIHSKNMYNSNLDLIFKSLNLKNDYAKLLGYNNYSEFILQDKIAITAERVYKFLSDIFKEIKPRRDKEILEIKNYKKENIYIWDLCYYERIIKHNKFGIDMNHIKNYFPLYPTFKKMIKLFEKFFQIEIIKTQTRLWHSDVQQYKVVCKKTKNILGYFITDLFSRDLKYNVNACFSITNGISNNNEILIPSECILSTNFIKKNNKIGTLLTCDEMETLFHEFGHVFHEIFTNSEYYIFSGSNMELDYIETPSQLFEFLFWTPKIIKYLSNHYITKEKLSDNLVSNIIYSKNYFIGLDTSKQISYTLIDLFLHSNDCNSKSQIIENYTEIIKKILDVEVDSSTSDINTFEHIMTNYSASYYVYLWSKVYAYELFTYLGFDKKKWYRYRIEVLEKNSQYKAQEVIKKFLGKTPDVKSYIKYINQVHI